MAVALREVEVSEAPQRLWKRLAQYGDEYRIVRVDSGTALRTNNGHRNVLEIRRENQSRWKRVELHSEAKGAAITIGAEIVDAAIRARELPFEPYQAHEPHRLDGNDAVDIQATWRERVDRVTGEAWGSQTTPFIRINVPNALGPAWHCPRQAEWLFVAQQIADIAVEGGWLPPCDDDDSITWN